MNLNPKELFDKALNELLPKFEKETKEYFKNFFEKKLKLYFCSPSDIQHYKNNPSVAWSNGVDVKDPDLGMACKMVNDFITENILDEKLQKHMQQYMSANFQKHLNEAMDNAMKHKANAIAFKAAKENKQVTKITAEFKIINFLQEEGVSIPNYSVMISPNGLELRFPYDIRPDVLERFAKAFPKCIIRTLGGHTSLAVFYDE